MKNLLKNFRRFWTGSYVEDGMDHFVIVEECRGAIVIWNDKNNFLPSSGTHRISFWPRSNLWRSFTRERLGSDLSQ